MKDLVDIQRWRYLLRSISGRMCKARLRCPNCENDSYKVIKNRKLVTALVRCETCDLLYRIPTDRPEFNSAFYQDDYKADFTTDCPSESRLRGFLETAFVGSSMEISGRINVLKALGVKEGSRVFDFGASWGYGTWQLHHAGYEVVGYELSKPRARYACEMLRIPVLDEVAKIEGPFDVFFSSHVLEHLPSPRMAFDLARRLLKPGGLFVAFTPNGSSAFQRAAPREYHHHWSAVHPLYLDDRFYLRAFPDRPKVLCSTEYGAPYELEQIRRWTRNDTIILDVAKSELGAIIVY